MENVFFLQCNNCCKLLLHPNQRLNFFSDYTHSVTCPYCQSQDTHFAKPLNYCYTNKPLQQFQPYAWHEATLDSPKSSTMSSPKIGSNESGYMSLSNGESNVMSGSSKASSIWGDKSLWNLSNSPNSTSSMQTANGSMCSSDGKESFWHSSTSSPISSSSSQYNNLNSLWGCSPIKDDDSLGSIWNIPKQQPEGNYEAPLPPPISYTQRSQPQLLRPQDIGGTTWSGMNIVNNNNISNGSVKMKEPVGSLWAHPTPPNLPLTLQQNYGNLLQSTNSKFQAPLKPMGGVAPNNFHPSNNNNNINATTSSCNMQLFSDEFLSYLNMIN